MQVENEIEPFITTECGMRICICCERRLATSETHCSECERLIRGYERIYVPVESVAFPIKSKLYLVGLAIVGLCAWSFFIKAAISGVMR